MEINCSFQRIVGGQCSQDKRSRAKEKGALILPLLSCGKNISAHAQSVGVTDVESEIDLILARASMFTAPDDISRMTICPAHRSSLGIGWRRGSQRCRVPETLSSHKHGKPRKADRGINKALSKTILKRTGIFIPVGSGKFTVWLLYDRGRSICWNFKVASYCQRSEKQCFNKPGFRVR